MFPQGASVPCVVKLDRTHDFFLLYIEALFLIYHYVMNYTDENMDSLGVIKTRNPKIRHLNYNLSHNRTISFECK